MLLYDWLHVVDLAIVPDCVASALLELTAPGMGLFMGSDQDERLRDAYVKFQALCKQHKVRFLTFNYPGPPPSFSPYRSRSLSLSISLSLSFSLSLSLSLSLTLSN